MSAIVKDPQRYGSQDLPKAGDLVLDHNGRECRVIAVYGAHRVKVRTVASSRQFEIQANDLRKARAA